MKYFNELLLLVALFLTGIISRLPFIEKFQSHWDGPNWSIAVVRYSFSQETPAPPGYPLYIALGKFIYYFINDPHLAIVTVSVLFAGIGAMVFYIVGKVLFNKTTGLIAAAIFLSAPATYFFGITANPYGALPTTAALLACVVYLIWFKKKTYGVLLGVVYSFAVGFRPQDAMFLTPLFLTGVFFLRWKERSFSFLALLIVSLFWFVPTVIAVGGLSEYMRHILGYLTNDASPDTSFSRLIEIWFILLRGFYLMFGIAGIALVFYLPLTLQKIRRVPLQRLYRSKDFTIFIFFLIWILPSSLFNLLVRSDHAAHQMAYLSGLSFLISYAIWRISKKNTGLLIVTVSFIVMFNLFTFFRDRDPENQKPYIDQSYHYSEIRKNDRRLLAKTTFIKERFLPDETLILTTPRLWRPYMYHFKEYKIYALDALVTTDSRYVHVRREAQNWNKKELIQKKHTVVIPAGIRTVVLLGDDEAFRIEGAKFFEYGLDAGSVVYVLPVKAGDTFLYGYKSLKKVSNESL